MFKRILDRVVKYCSIPFHVSNHTFILVSILMIFAKKYTTIYRFIKIKLATLVEGDSKDPFLIATTPRIAQLYP